MSTLPGGGGTGPTPPTSQSQPLASPATQSILDKYGFVLPVAGAFATTFAVDLVKKTVIKGILGDGSSAPPAHAEASDISQSSNPALDAFQASPYGDQGTSINSNPLVDGGTNVDLVFDVEGGVDIAPRTLEYSDGVDIDADAGPATEFGATAEWDADALTGVDVGVEFDGGPVMAANVDVDLSSGGEGAGEIVASLFEGIVNIF